MASTREALDYLNLSRPCRLVAAVVVQGSVVALSESPHSVCHHRVSSVQSPIAIAIATETTNFLRHRNCRPLTGLHSQDSTPCRLNLPIAISVARLTCG